MNGTTVYSKSASLKAEIATAKAGGKTIGFVPTMGALHEGHLALVRRAKKECDIVVVSIFVNPTQFNNPQDLEKYPRTLEKDVALLNELGGILVFAPTFDQVYTEQDTFPGVNIDEIESILEGEFRPGHFQGVVNVVYNLFDIVQPNKAYFGLKDFQQVAVIQEMVRQLALPVTIVACETLRESTGLALSSRNMRLTAEEKRNALIIPNTLFFLKDLVETVSPEEAKRKAVEFFEKGLLKLEYLEIVDGRTLMPLKNEWVKGAVCCIAAYCGSVRLIDNLILKD